MIKKILACGDSFCWGEDLVDTSIDISKIKFESSHIEPCPKELNHIPENNTYRLNHRYITLFAEKLDISADMISDVSQSGISNDAILRRLLLWLADHGYTDGSAKEELFVSIGWTCPDRTEFYHKQEDTFLDSMQKWIEIRTGVELKNYLPFGPWCVRDGDKWIPENIKDFFCQYLYLFGQHEGALQRYIQTVWTAQTVLNSFGIKYVMHQAYFDVPIKENVNNLDPRYIKLWDQINSIKYIHKDHHALPTMMSVMENHAAKQYNISDIKSDVGVHPNALGHKIWSDYMYDYCKANQLL